MRNASIAVLILALASLPAVAAPLRLPPPGARVPVALQPAGLQLRDGAPDGTVGASPSPAPTPMPAPPARARAAKPPPAAAPMPAAQTTAPLETTPRSPIDEAVDAAMRQRFSGGAVPRGPVPDALAYGAPVSPAAQRVLDDIARAAGIAAGQLAAVGSTPRDQARLLVEKLFDPAFGEARVRVQYGTAGALAAEAYRRVRDVYQVLGLNPEQKSAVVDVVSAALIAGGALGQADDPAIERIDVDPGTHADRARFERAIAANEAVARCLRPARGDRFYALELPRRGGSGGADCRDPWSDAPVIAAQPEAGDARTSSGAAGDVGAPRTGGRDGSMAVAPLPPASTGGDPGSMKYIVTDGPNGPVVTVAPAR